MNETTEKKDFTKAWNEVWGDFGKKMMEFLVILLHFLDVLQHGLVLLLMQMFLGYMVVMVVLLKCGLVV